MTRVNQAHQRGIDAHDAGRANALQHACHCQRAKRVRQGAGNGGQREDQHADQVNPPVADDVAQGCQRQQQRQRGDLVSVDDPNRLSRCGLQLACDVGQGQIDDGAVQHRHDNSEYNHQHGPGALMRGQPILNQHADLGQNCLLKIVSRAGLQAFFSATTFRASLHSKSAVAERMWQR